MRSVGRGLFTYRTRSKSPRGEIRKNRLKATRFKKRKPLGGEGESG